MDKNDLTKKSKFLSLVLRHKPETIGLELDENGWANVDELLQKCVANNSMTMAILEEIVATNNKKRFAFNDDKTKIRASQGHSIDVDLNLEEKEPPFYLFHGTAEKNIESIKEKGLIKSGRQYVHLSSDYDTAVKVGQRHGNPVVLMVRAKTRTYRGFKFFISDNNVWLKDHVEPEDIVFDIDKEEAQRMIDNHNKFQKKMHERYAKHDVLLKNIKDNLPELEKELESVSGLWYEDRMYRFYHHSFKVYDLVGTTEDIVKLLRKINPNEKGENVYRLDPYFERIYMEGTCQNRKFEISHNSIFDTVTRPFIEAFFHARYFLEMAVKYGKELDEAPSSLPSGWAALLELYNIR